MGPSDGVPDGGNYGILEGSSFGSILCSTNKLVLGSAKIIKFGSTDGDMLSSIVVVDDRDTLNQNIESK